MQQEGSLFHYASRNSPEFYAGRARNAFLRGWRSVSDGGREIPKSLVINLHPRVQRLSSQPAHTFGLNVYNVFI